MILPFAVAPSEILKHDQISHRRTPVARSTLQRQGGSLTAFGGAAVDLSRAAFGDQVDSMIRNPTLLGCPVRM